MTKTEQRARERAKTLGLSVIVLPERSYWYKKGDRYVLRGREVKPRSGETYEDYQKRKAIFHYEGTQYYAKNLAELNKAITTLERRKKKSEMTRKLNGHRLRYGYTTVPRKARIRITPPTPRLTR